MLRRPPRSTRTATLFPYTTLFRSILINNAGVLRDKTFAKMEPVDFDFVVKVHLSGSAFVTKACWDTFREQAYGRILMTASSTGLFGNFGQAKDRKSVGLGTSVSVRVDLGGRRIIKKINTTLTDNYVSIVTHDTTYETCR